MINLHLYFSKVRNRLHTLLIPYLLWNLIGFLYFILKHYPPLSFVFHGTNVITISFQNFLKVFWEFRFEGLGESKSMPIDFPLWYMRDLMIIILCSPLLNIFIKLKSPFIALLGILWFAFNINFYGIEIAGFFFYFRRIFGCL